MKPIIYTLDDCSFCHDMTDWLDDIGVAYEQVDAEELDDIEVVPTIRLGDQLLVDPTHSDLLKAFKAHGLLPKS